MIAYKGFTKDLTAILGKGEFRYKEGVTYKEKAAKAANTGFHCCENPLDTLEWYSNMEDSVYYIVDAGGTVNEDGHNTRLSCTEITLLHKLELYEFVEEAIKYMYLHPFREWNRHVKEEEAEANETFAIARGKSPRARGKTGTVIALVKEQQMSQEIEDYEIYIVGQHGVRPDTWYGI